MVRNHWQSRSLAMTAGLTCYKKLAKSGSWRVCAVVATLPPLEATAPDGYPDGAVGALVCLVGPALEAGVGECFDDAVGAGGG
ncbi:hypothetical protein, partial [Streptomyces globisporus]|uniref:hypothetical protein n=1 Tax=Streptomyces globisporus TaxID=1908 RepID=UPI00373AF552